MERPSTPPSILRLQSDQEFELPAPRQDDRSISEYFKFIKFYALLRNKDLNDVDIKVKFIVGLSPDNKKRAEEFGVKKPLKEIVKYLVRELTLSTEIQKYKVEELKQGNELVRKFYQKLERLRKLSECDEEDLRMKIFCGISSKNQDEVKLWGMNFPLDELIERLETLKQLSE
ncbi:hypothetical protein RclHR1_28230001 [Rhizophagus clarus]|uniref:Uncharacterized protein n=1 Tax=Rhizophagus clarus TaxID=94130 RepID=A0A2Z6RIZ0_9GLOM|nr:hypothetical protein RclHR1_28230001 [Rhizophagus clarus]GES95109.1 hypothetical protein GLOIN_2v1829228 [Rhizophagus clarus]